MISFKNYKLQVHALRFMCNKIPSIFGICIRKIKQHVVQLGWLARFHSLGSPIVLSKSFCKLIRLQSLTVQCYASQGLKKLYTETVLNAIRYQ